MSLLTNETEQNYADFERGQQNRALARKAVEHHRRKRAFVEIDILEAVMEESKAKAEALAREMTAEERAELLDHLQTMRQILFDADE